MYQAIQNTLLDPIYLSQLLITILLMLVYYSQQLSGFMMVAILILTVFSGLQITVATYKSYSKIISSQPAHSAPADSSKIINPYRSDVSRNPPLIGPKQVRDLNLNSLRYGGERNVRDNNFNNIPQKNLMNQFREEQKSYQFDNHRGFSMPKNLHRIEEQDREFDIPTQKYANQSVLYSDNEDTYQPRPRNNKHQLLSKLANHFSNAPQASEKVVSAFQTKFESKSMGGVSQTFSRLAQCSVVKLPRDHKEDYYSTSSGIEELKALQVKFCTTQDHIKKVFKITVVELEKYAKDWYLQQMIPALLSSLQGTLTSLNLVLREYFDRRVRESDLFAKDWVDENNVGTTPVSIDQLLAMFASLEKHGSWLWVPDNIEKFNRDHKEKFLKNLKELQLYDKILSVKNGDRSFGSSMRGSILDRLIVMNSNKSKTFEFGQELVPHSPTDMEILSSVFINLIDCSIEYERGLIVRRGNNQQLKAELRFEDYKNRISQFSELFAPLSVWVVNSDQMNIEPPSGDDVQERTQSPVYFVSQKFSAPHEPSYHVYSDLLYAKMAERDHKYLYTKIGPNSLFVSIGYYFVHLLCLPRFFFTKLVQHDYDLKFLSLVLDGAIDLQFRVMV